MQPIRISSMALELGYWLAIITIWELIWKGIAMWKSAKNGQKNWFIAIFVLNTVGLLPIVYLYFFQRGKRFDVLETEPMDSIGKLEPLTELKEVKAPKKRVVKKKTSTKKKAAPKKRKATKKKK